MLHNAKDSNQIVQAPLKIIWGLCWLLSALRKENKSSSEKSKNGKKVNAQMTKDENGVKCKF